MDLLRQDLLYALRRIARSPGFTVVAALSLALGIGANAAIFSIVNGVLLRELPVSAPDRLVEIYTSDDDGPEYATTSYPDVADLRAATRDVLEDVTAYELFFAQVQTGDEQGARVLGEVVTGNYFDVLGVQPVMGRAFSAEEGETPHPVVVVGHAYWRVALGGDPGVIGRTLRLNRRPFTIVGVAPPAFKGMFPGLVADVFTPAPMVNQLKPMTVDRLQQRGNRGLFVKGRLLPGVSAERAHAAVAAVGRRLAAEYPETNEGRRMSAIPTNDVAFHPMVDKALIPVAALLLAMVGMVLLIACVNLASFLLARAADRRREIAIRLALGAKRGHLVRQLLMESTLLALIGGSAGVLLAVWVVRALVRFQPPIAIPINLDIDVDGNVLAFTFLVSVAAGIAFGLAPALQATRPDLAPTLKSEAGNVTGERRRWSLRNGLVVAQMAISLVLLIGSGLFLRSLQKAEAIDPGFDTGPAAILWPDLDLSGVPSERTALLQDRVREELLALPGVTAVGMADRLPLGANVQTRGIMVDGIEPPPGRDNISVDFTQADAGYFTAMGVPIVAGRNFEPSEGPNTPAVAIVSEAAARRFWPDRNAAGELFYLGAGRDSPVRVIGVARDTKVRTLGEAPRAYFYLNARQLGSLSLQIVVRGAGDEGELVARARSAVLALDSDLVLMEAKTMREHLALFLFPPRMAALLLSCFGALALVLAAVGLYGVVSHTVARRRREMGIRLTLGARPAQLVGMVTAGGARLVAVGAGVGVVLAAVATLPLSRFLFGIQSTDIATFVVIPLLLGSVGVLAAWVPARRASRADPIAALRSE